MNLVIDGGNTLLKAGLFEGNQLVQTLVDVTVTELTQLAVTHQVKHIIISSVGSKTDELQEAFNDWGAITLRHHTPQPLQISYATPHTLGMDRLAAVAGAYALYPQSNSLVIDAGSCITYDMVDKDGNYHGGNITPGLRMKLKALNAFTARLPLVEPRAIDDFIGNDTSTSMLSGVIFGTVSEMDGLISLYKKKFGDLQVILCGGDAAFFESKIKHHIFVVPQLVLIGLNSILEYNVSKK